MISYIFRIVITFLVVTLIIKGVFLDFSSINSDSMANTLLSGDFTIVNKVAYNFAGWEYKEIEKDDIIVFSSPNINNKIKDILHTNDYNIDENYINEKITKRVVGIPGDTILYNEDFLEINNINKLNLKKSAPKTKIILGDNMYFVLGDNIENSIDSRYFGPVERNDIIGKIIMIYWSKNQIGINFERIGHIF